MNNAIFENSMESYHTTKLFIENPLAIEVNKTHTVMTKPVYLGLSILELYKILMYEFSMILRN